MADRHCSGIGGTGIISSAGGAVAALFPVVLAGAYLRSPLRRVPENAIKFVVGAMIVAFWDLLVTRSTRRLDDMADRASALIALVVFYILGGLLADRCAPSA